MALLSDIGLENVSAMPFLNTNTLLDIALGYFERGIDSRWYLQGGLAPITGVCGRAQTYKSTIVDSLAAQVLLNYPTVEIWKHDTEQNVFTLSRFDHMAGSEVSNRCTLTNSASLRLDEYLDKLKELCAHKEKHKKDYLVETPFFDTNGKQIITYTPTLVDIDSFTCLRPHQEEILMEKVNVEDGSHNMSDMTDGKIKRKLMFEFSKWAHRYGIYFILTAHIDDTPTIDPRNPAQKQLQFMKQSDRLKGVGSQFEFLCNVLLQGTSPSPILDSQKGPEYPNGNPMSVDINDLDSKILIKNIAYIRVYQEVYDKYFEYWIDKDFNIFEVLKDKISDKIKQKYSYIFQATNFDLI